MAMYTIELRTLINDYQLDIFNFDYPFYCNDKEVKKEFEELFINRFYYHEIGAETYNRWQQQLKTKLLLKMPYYTQLYQTQWEQTGKNMMESKNLIETTTHKLSSQGSNTGEVIDETTAKQQDQSSASSSGEGFHDESLITDGVNVVNLDTENKTGTSKDSSEAQSSSSSEVEGQTSKNVQSSSNNETTLTEETIFESKGDIGIQTPAYAITEWRKVIININEMILEECHDLFMQIY